VHDPSLGGPGFKRFRPVVRQANGALRRLTNAEIAKNPQYGDFSLEQSQLGLENFYDRMDDVMSPEPLDPVRAMQGAITSLEEQVKTRATAVENGRKWQAGAREVEMPNGPSIFETSGAWEDFSTPARDLRLLIAIDVVRGYPDRVARRSDRYAMPLLKSAADVKAELQRALASELASRKFTYTRSDGSAWTLSLKDVLDRMQDLEMGYNPNDCVELRWGIAGVRGARWVTAFPAAPAARERGRYSALPSTRLVAVRTPAMRHWCSLHRRSDEPCDLVTGENGRSKTRQHHADQKRRRYHVFHESTHVRLLPAS
jgi:hypothetical protein